MREEPVIRLPLTQEEALQITAAFAHAKATIDTCPYCRAVSVPAIRERIHRHLRAAAKNGAQSSLPHKEALRNV
jgi:hypothetical protein